MLSKLSSILVSRWHKVVILLVIALMTSGCVNYEVGVNFDSPNRGAIVQNIRLNDRLMSFSSGAAQTWLTSIEARVRRLQGKTRRLSNQEILVTIPFNNGQDLQKKFNVFFSSEPDKKSQSKKTVELPNFTSKLSLRQANFLLLERTKFSYDVDLRSLGLTASDGSVLVDPSSIINLEFKLNTPWGARSIAKKSIPARREGHQLVWTLQPGQNNHLEAAFWMPNSLGIATLFVIAIVGVGVYLKNQQSPIISSASR